MTRTNAAAAAASGAVAGAVGTVAMSALMLGAGRLGLMGTQPPRRVVDRAADEAGVRAGDGTRDVAASVVHLAIGAVAGTVLQLVERLIRRVARREPPVAPTGAAFGLGLWAVNYMALAPALNLLPPATRDRPTRPPVMIAAHLVFGVVTAVIGRRLADRAGAR